MGGVKDFLTRLAFKFARVQMRTEIVDGFMGAKEVVVLFKRIGKHEIVLETYTPPPVHYNCRCVLTDNFTNVREKTRNRS